MVLDKNRIKTLVDDNKFYRFFDDIETGFCVEFTPDFGVQNTPHLGVKLTHPA